MIYNSPYENGLQQVLVPIDSTRPDFVERMQEAVQTLADFESRSAAAVVTDLLNFDSDVLRYRVDSRRTEKGTLPLTQAIDLLGGAKQSLMAAAHSALVRKKYHPKLSRTEAVQLLDRCQLNQTEQRSFVVAIACPMRAVDANEAGTDDSAEPFARQATSLLTRALLSLDQAIEEDRVNSIVDEAEPLVSANLCDALLKMRPKEEDGILEFLPSWAPSTPMGSAADLPSQIVFSYDEFEAVEEVYRQLRPTEASESKMWIAYVDELKGTEIADGVREGEVVFTVFDGDEVIRARARLTREQYQTACLAHNPIKPLFVVGRLNRGARVSRLLDVTKVEPVPANS
ncbi:MAG: hypothetical protein SGJ19_26600 [Planctomycetia bacterium]|nr:hypothetical protein [Planctomycetia bacterium]